MGLAWAGLIYHLFLLWSGSPDYSSHYVIPLGSCWLIFFHDRERFKSADGGTSLLGYLPLLLGMASIVPAWYILSQVSESTFVFWWLTLGYSLATLSLALCTWGWARTRILFFPILFIFFSLPLPDAIFFSFRTYLQELVTGLATQGLKLSGCEVVRKGFEIHIPSGPLEIVEACSGIRSMTTIPAMAAFVAYYRRFSFGRGVLLFLFSIPIVIFCNTMRIVVTGILQENFGTVVTTGIYHEMLGYGMALLALFITILISNLLATKRTGTQPVIVIPIPEHSPERILSGISCLLIILSSVAASGYLGWKSYSRIWMQDETVSLANLPLKIGEWQGEAQFVDKEISQVLGADQIIRRVYSNPIGHQVHVWVMYWPASSLVKRGHHPEVCLPNRGFKPVSKSVEHLKIGDRQQIVLIEQLFRRENQDQMLHYWTQDGHHFVTEEEVAQQNQLSTSEWILKQFRTTSQQDQVPRIGILIGMPATGPLETTRKTLTKFTVAFARELYNTCPWAVPDGE